MHQRIADRLKRRFRQRLAVMFNEIIAFHTGFAVHRGGVAQGAPAASTRPAPGNIGIPEMQKLQGVTGRFLHRHIARHRGHQLQIKLGANSAAAIAAASSMPGSVSRMIGKRIVSP
jgi:hypothetical protein